MSETLSANRTNDILDFASVLSGHASMHFTDKAALKQSAVLNRSSDDFVIDTWTPLDSAGKFKRIRTILISIGWYQFYNIDIVQSISAFAFVWLASLNDLAQSNQRFSIHELNSITGRENALLYLRYPTIAKLRLVQSAAGLLQEKLLNFYG